MIKLFFLDIKHTEKIIKRSIKRLNYNIKLNKKSSKFNK